jgi:signal transduction histidine kinase
VAVPLIVLATIVTAVLIQRERVAVESGLRDTVRALSLALDRELVNTTTTLKAIAASLASERGDMRLFRDEAARVFESQQSDWLTLLIVDPSGRIIIDARGPMSSEGGLDQWIDLRPGEIRAPVIGDVRRDPRTQEYGFPVAVPVAADSPGRYVVVAVVRPLTIERMLTAPRFENIPMMAVFDGSARLVARHGAAEQGTGQRVGPLMQSMLERHATEHLVRGTNREGVAVYTAFRRSGLGNWGVAVGVPAVAIEAGPRRVLWTVGIVSLALIAVSLAIAAVAGRRIQGAVTDLAKGATLLGHGQRPEPTRSHLSEVRSVSSALITAADTIQERSEAARAAQAQAERANRAKDEFLAMLGHELRNPLGAIAGAVTVLGVAKADQPTTEQARAVICRQSQHLARLVDDLLDVSRVTSGRVTLIRQPVDLGEIVTRAVGMWRSAGRFDEHQLSVETESVWVNGDETRLEQILSNLVGNALKYTPARGNVSIRVSVRGDGAVLESGRYRSRHSAEPSREHLRPVRPG